MRNQIVVLPLDHLALRHLDVCGIKLETPHLNLSDSGWEGICDGRCSSIGRSNITLAPEIPRANHECAADDYRKPTNAEKPKSQRSAPRARLAPFAVNRIMHILHSLRRRSINSLAMRVRDRGVFFHLRFAFIAGGDADPAGSFQTRFLTLFAQRSLQLFRMLQVSNEDRATAFEKTLQFSVAGMWNQRFVEQTDDGFVIAHFVIDVCLIELSPRQCLELSQFFLAVRLQAQIGRA